MRIPLFSHTADPAKDEPLLYKSRSYIMRLLAEGRAWIVDGKTANDTRLVQLYPPIDRSVPQTEMEASLGWNPPFGRYRSTALNEGRSGQFSVGYPIPYAWEGRPLNMHVKVVNAGDPIHGAPVPA